MPLSSVALDSVSSVAQVWAQTGAPDHALSACWPTVATRRRLAVRSMPLLVPYFFPSSSWSILSDMRLSSFLI